jgi:hypothetical protein
MAEKHGLRFFNDDGSLLMEIGAHVVKEFSGFSERIGCIASGWAQAEVSLYCLFAVLLNVSPDETASRLKKYKTAARAAEGARDIAADYLSGEELQKLNEILDRMDSVRSRRNRIQHDVWAKKGGIDDKLFAVHADQYLDFITNMVGLSESALADGEKSDRIIALAGEFSAMVSEGYTISELKELEDELGDLNKDLMSGMFTRLIARKKADLRIKIGFKALCK